MKKQKIITMSSDTQKMTIGNGIRGILTVENNSQKDLIIEGWQNIILKPFDKITISL